MSTSSGTSDRSASTTAAWKWVAAVPLVHSSTAGSPWQPDAERRERGGPLVVEDVERRLGRAGAARAPSAWSATRGDDGVAHARVDPFVDERGAERRCRSSLAMSPGDAGGYTSTHRQVCVSRSGPTSSARGATSASAASSERRHARPTRPTSRSSCLRPYQLDPRCPRAVPNRCARRTPASSAGPSERRRSSITSRRRRRRGPRVPPRSARAGEHAARPPPAVARRARRASAGAAEGAAAAGVLHRRRDVGDPDVLAGCAADVGLDRGRSARGPRRRRGRRGRWPIVAAGGRARHHRRADLRRSTDAGRSRARRTRTSFSRRAADRCRHAPLSVDLAGRDVPRRRLVFVHGFTQTVPVLGPDRGCARSPALTTCSAARRAGHGGSAASSSGRSRRTARRSLVPRRAGGRRTSATRWVDGSRCTLALAPSRRRRALVLVGATAGHRGPDRARGAARAEDERRPRGRDAMASTRSSTGGCAQPMFAGSRHDEAGLDDRRRNTVAGLASSLRLAGTGAQEPLWHRLGELTMPVLVVAGEHDAKFAAIAPRDGRGSPDPSCASSSTPATPPTSSSRTCHGDLREFLAVRCLRARRSAAEREADGGQQPVGQLQPAGRAEHGDQRRPGRATRHDAAPAAPRAAWRRARAAPAGAAPRPTRRHERAGDERDVQPRVRRSPSRTASVRLPDAVSVGMSRRLLTTSSAHAARRPSTPPARAAR